MAAHEQESVLPEGEFETGNDTVDIWRFGPRSAGLVVVHTAIAFLAVVSNGMVITVMLSRRRIFNSHTNHLILHQSIVDAITGVVFFLHKVVKDPDPVVSMENTIYDELVCRFLFVDVLLWCMYATSTYNLVVIALERFAATCHPARHRTSLNAQKLKLAMASCWAIGFGYGLHHSLTFEPFQGQCIPVETDLSEVIAVALLVVLIEYIVPVIILIYAYTRILVMLIKKIHATNDEHNPFSRGKRAVLKTVVAVSVMFVVCWTPAEYEYIFATITGSQHSDTFYSVVIGLVACNSCVNPIIYCLMYHRFRSELKDMLLKRLRGNRVHDVQPL